MRRHPAILIAIAAVTLALLALLLTLARSYSMQRLHAKCYFQDAQGLRAGDEVRVAGVAVGSVSGVRVRPDLRDHPAEVDIIIDTSSGIKIPDDAVVSVKTAGVLGQSFAEIDILHTTGRPLAEGGVLRTRETPAMTDWLKCLANIVDHKPCELQAKGEAAKPSPHDVPTSK